MQHVYVYRMQYTVQLMLRGCVFFTFGLVLTHQCKTGARVLLLSRYCTKTDIPVKAPCSWKHYEKKKKNKNRKDF